MRAVKTRESNSATQTLPLPPLSELLDKTLPAPEPETRTQSQVDLSRVMAAGKDEREQDIQQTESKGPDNMLVKTISSWLQMPRVIEILQDKEQTAVRLEFAETPEGQEIRAYVLQLQERKIGELIQTTVEKLKEQKKEKIMSAYQINPGDKAGLAMNELHDMRNREASAIVPNTVLGDLVRAALIKPPHQVAIWVDDNNQHAVFDTIKQILEEYQKAEPRHVEAVIKTSLRFWQGAVPKDEKFPKSYTYDQFAAYLAANPKKDPAPSDPDPKTDPNDNAQQPDPQNANKDDNKEDPKDKDPNDHDPKDPGDEGGAKLDVGELDNATAAELDKDTAGTIDPLAALPPRDVISSTDTTEPQPTSPKTGEAPPSAITLMTDLLQQKGVTESAADKKTSAVPATKEKKSEPIKLDLDSRVLKEMNLECARVDKISRDGNYGFAVTNDGRRFYFSKDAARWVDNKDGVLELERKRKDLPREGNVILFPKADLAGVENGTAVPPLSKFCGVDNLRDQWNVVSKLDPKYRLRLIMEENLADGSRKPYSEETVWESRKVAELDDMGDEIAANSELLKPRDEEQTISGIKYNMHVTSPFEVQRLNGTWESCSDPRVPNAPAPTLAPPPAPAPVASPAVSALSQMSALEEIKADFLSLQNNLPELQADIPAGSLDRVDFIKRDGTYLPICRAEMNSATNTFWVHVPASLIAGGKRKEITEIISQALRDAAVDTEPQIKFRIDRQD